MFGGEGNDTYLVHSTLSTYIVDHGTSTEDMLSIYDETYDNLHFVFNVDSTGAIDGNTMKVLNNANFELWQADMLDDSIKGITISRDDLGGSWNAIENFEDAGLGDECRSITINAIDTMRADIASWLAEEGYTDVADVFENEKAEGDIDTLIAKFDITDQWHQAV